MINLYGKQESRQTVEEIDNGWEEVLAEIIKIEAKDEKFLLIGDLNQHIGNTLVETNHPKKSHAGKLLLNLLEKDSVTLINATNKAINGPFTRYEKNDPSNEDKKSLLDLAIVSSNLV